ncbi:MAG: phosphopantetheine-binding protein, partial [Thermoanaerobaculia bacterium]
RGVARGYLGRLELTAERFVVDPATGGRRYRTGDRVRQRDDGELDFVGRVDHQVKIRGFRIEPGEIEAVMRHHPPVRECVVTCHDNGRGDRRLVAYVVPEPGADLDPAELRRRLRAVLPDHMVPAAYVVLDALPRNANGKLNREALPPPDGERLERDKTYTAPRTAVEEAMAAIWGEVLGMARVGVEDDFFDLGGHSLLGVQVVSRVAEAFGVEIPLRQLFGAPTVAGLAQTVERLRWAAAGQGDELVPVGAEEGEL